MAGLVAGVLAGGAVALLSVLVGYAIAVREVDRKGTDDAP